MGNTGITKAKTLDEAFAIQEGENNFLRLDIARLNIIKSVDELNKRLKHEAELLEMDMRIYDSLMKK